jgi:glycosyltransferase involved in cell wall biosynthesis
MRILLINNFFRSVGGVERVFFAERELLAQHGHEVIVFSTDHPANMPSPYAHYFPSGVDFHAPGNLFKKAARFFYSREVEQKLEALIRDTKPEVAHIQGMFDILGPTVLRVLKKHGIPVVFTAHAYKLVCPSGRLFTRGHIDESCRRHLLSDVFGRAVQNSFAKSLWGTFALWWHLKRGTFDAIDRIISPSMFLIHKHVEFGWDAARFVHIPNPIDITKFAVASSTDAYFLFVGRLVEEKGVEVFLRAAERLPQFQFKIVGDGPSRDSLQKMVHDKKLMNVSFEGFHPPRDVVPYVANAMAVVVPSVCYETDPFSVLEAQAQGKVVIASYTGGIPEQIRSGETGFLFERGNAEALADVMEKVAGMSATERKNIGKQARGFVDTIRTPELFYEALMDVLGAKKAHK